MTLWVGRLTAASKRSEKEVKELFEGFKERFKQCKGKGWHSKMSVYMKDWFGGRNDMLHYFAHSLDAYHSLKKKGRTQDAHQFAGPYHMIVLPDYAPPEHAERHHHKQGKADLTVQPVIIG